jgi:hypothetical protein
MSVKAADCFRSWMTAWGGDVGLLVAAHIFMLVSRGEHYSRIPDLACKQLLPGPTAGLHWLTRQERYSFIQFKPFIHSSIHSLIHCGERMRHPSSLTPVKPQTFLCGPVTTYDG